MSITQRATGWQPRPGTEPFTGVKLDHYLGGYSVGLSMHGIQFRLSLHSNWRFVTNNGYVHKDGRRELAIYCGTRCVDRIYFTHSKKSGIRCSEENDLRVITHYESEYNGQSDRMGMFSPAYKGLRGAAADADCIRRYGYVGRPPGERPPKAHLFFVD